MGRSTINCGYSSARLDYRRETSDKSRFYFLGYYKPQPSTLTIQVGMMARTNSWKRGNQIVLETVRAIGDFLSQVGMNYPLTNSHRTVENHHFDMF